VENLATFHPHIAFSDLLLVQSDSVTCAQDEARFVVVPAPDLTPDARHFVHREPPPVENLATFHPHIAFSDLLLVQSDSVTSAQDEVRFVVVPDLTPDARHFFRQ
jgi:hypothetical protein